MPTAERTIGVILRTRPLTETSLIVQWLARDFGRISTVAKGARRAKSPFLGKLDLFFLADFSFQRSLRSDLHTLREVSVQSFHEPLRRDLGYLQQACYFAHLIEQTTETDTPLPAFFDLLTQTLDVLPQSPPGALTVFAFEMKLLTELGLSPGSTYRNLPAGTREILDQLPNTDWAMLRQLRLAPAQSREIDAFLRRFLSFEIGRVPKSRMLALRPFGGSADL